MALSLLLHHAAPVSRSHVDLMRARLGHLGELPQSRRAVATQGGVSRVAVDNTEARVRLLARAVGPPASLLQALDVFAGGEVRDAVTATVDLHDAGLLRDALHPASLLAWAQLFDVDARFRVHRLRDGTHLVVPTSQEAAVRAFEAAVTAVLRHGIGPIPYAAAAGLAPTAARRLVTDRPDTELLGDWMCRAPDTARRGVGPILRRMLSAGPQTLTDLHEGVERPLRYLPGWHRPTPSVLASYLRSQPWVAGDEDGLLTLTEPSCDLQRYVVLF